MSCVGDVTRDRLDHKYEQPNLTRAPRIIAKAVRPFSVAVFGGARASPRLGHQDKQICTEISRHQTIRHWHPLPLCHLPATWTLASLLISPESGRRAHKGPTSSHHVLRPRAPRGGDRKGCRSRGRLDRGRAAAPSQDVDVYVIPPFRPDTGLCARRKEVQGECLSKASMWSRCCVVLTVRRADP